MRSAIIDEEIRDEEELTTPGVKELETVVD
jgi:hypothetical protein